MFWAFLTPALIGSRVILVGLAVLAFIGAPSDPGPVDQDDQ
jgi:hypothetical protein